MPNQRYVLYLLPVMALACGQAAGGSHDGGPNTPDSGVALPDGQPSVDAATPATDAAGVIDANVSVGPVTITVSTSSGPMVGTTVVFQNVDDSVVAIETTDDNGSATAIMAAGGSLSVVRSRPGLESVHSILGVEPGDDIRYGSVPVTTEDIQITLPDSGQINTNYLAFSRCGSSSYRPGPVVTFRRLVGCSGADLFIHAKQNGLPYEDYGAFVVQNVDLTQGALDFSDRTYAPALPVDVILRNTPPTISGGDIGIAATTVSGAVWLQASVDVSNVRLEGTLTPSVSTLVKIPNIGATSMKVVANFLWTSAADNVSFMIVHDIASRATTHELDIAALNMPTMTVPAEMDTSGVITWSENGANRADSVDGWFRIRRASGVLDRTFSAPHQAASIRLPTLPSQFTDANLMPTDAPERKYLFLNKGTGGYRAYRQFGSDRTRYINSLHNAGDRHIYTSVL